VMGGWVERRRVSISHLSNPDARCSDLEKAPRNQTVVCDAMVLP